MNTSNVINTSKIEIRYSKRFASWTKSTLRRNQKRIYLIIVKIRTWTFNLSSSNTMRKKKINSFEIKSTKIENETKKNQKNENNAIWKNALEITSIQHNELVTMTYFLMNLLQRCIFSEFVTRIVFYTNNTISKKRVYRSKWKTNNKSKKKHIFVKSKKTSNKKKRSIKKKNI